MSTKIYVGNLSFNTMEDTVRDAFEQYGQVVSCKLISDRDTGRSKGFAFVEMGSTQEASKAIASLDGSNLDGRNMRVNEARPQESNRRSFQNSRY
ncbi:MAG: RNA-binding protein [Bdellovibrionales bacterium]|nr:RNA-binding protein [Bdellovibrionales bacterium]